MGGGGVGINISYFALMLCFVLIFKQNEISESLPECEAVVNLAGENILNPLKR